VFPDFSVSTAILWSLSISPPPLLFLNPYADAMVFLQLISSSFLVFVAILAASSPFLVHLFLVFPAAPQTEKKALAVGKRLMFQALFGSPLLLLAAV